jgi:hypothetical protein
MRSLTISRSLNVAAIRNVAILQNGKPFDEADADFLKILLHGPKRSEPHDRHWAVIWLRPLWQHPAGEYVFKVLAQNQTRESDPFSLDLTKVEHICPCEAETPEPVRKPPQPRRAYHIHRK